MAETCHGSAAVSAGRAVLIRGPSGSGKSDLLLRLIGLPMVGPFASPFVLVADDRVQLEARDGRVWASAPARLEGQIEVRGVGILTLPSAASAPVRLVVDLVPRPLVPRLPEPDANAVLLGLPHRRLQLAAFDASTPLKIALALSESVD